MARTVDRPAPGGHRGVLPGHGPSEDDRGGRRGVRRTRHPGRGPGLGRRDRHRAGVDGERLAGVVVRTLPRRADGVRLRGPVEARRRRRAAARGRPGPEGPEVPSDDAAVRPGRRTVRAAVGEGRGTGADRAVPHRHVWDRRGHARGGWDEDPVLASGVPGLYRRGLPRAHADRRALRVPVVPGNAGLRAAQVERVHRAVRVGPEIPPRRGPAGDRAEALRSDAVRQRLPVHPAGPMVRGVRRAGAGRRRPPGHPAR